MSEKKASTKDERTRNWTFVVYPDSAPQNWREIIDEDHIQWIESPLHDQDKVANDEMKKAHWQVLVMYGGLKSYKQIEELTQRINATIPQKCASTKGLVRYMVHMDNPEKFQYSRSEIIGHGGADVAEYLKATGASRYLLIREMMDYVKENHVTEMNELIYYAMAERFDDWFPLLCDNSAYIMNALIKSNRHSAMR